MERNETKEMSRHFPLENIQSKGDELPEDASRRIGAERGLIDDPEELDSWNEEIAELFERSAL